MSNLKSIIPGADLWPRFVQNQSERYEGRSVCVKLEKSPSSVLPRAWKAPCIPIAVAHGEGAPNSRTPTLRRSSVSPVSSPAASWTAVTNITEHYPLNNNGSPFGMTALTTTTGRVTILMPHPERVHRSVCMSWSPKDSPEDSPWMQMFYNARAWVG